METQTVCKVCHRGYLELKLPPKQTHNLHRHQISSSWIHSREVIVVRSRKVAIIIKNKNSQHPAQP
jgi:hypothetical protein